MAGDTSPITRLRAAAAILRAAGGTDATWLADGIDAYQDGAPIGETLDSVLGLARTVGGGTWWDREAQDRRNMALRLLRDSSFAGLGVTAAAVEVARAVNRRATSKAPPASDRDKLADAVLRSGAKMPKPRRLLAILRG